MVPLLSQLACEGKKIFASAPIYTKIKVFFEGTYNKGHSVLGYYWGPLFMETTKIDIYRAQASAAGATAAVAAAALRVVRTDLSSCMPVSKVGVFET